MALLHNSIRSSVAFGCAATAYGSNRDSVERSTISTPSTTMLGISFQTSRAANASSSTNQPLKAAKKYRSDDDSDKQIVRCKRKLDFIADRMKTPSIKQQSGERVTSTSGDPIFADLQRPTMTSRRRPPDIVARRNERERKRVSLINRTFETSCPSRHGVIVTSAR